MSVYYVRKDRALDGSDGPFEPDGTISASGLWYWFDGSDAAATDPNGAWTDETNADDSDITTVAYTTTSGTESTAQLKIEGTNAPASGDSISSVQLWVFLGSGNVSTGGNMKIYTDSEGEQLEFASGLGLATAGEWRSQGGIGLTAPSGGWTWAHVQALEMLVWGTNTDRLEIAAVGVLVHTTTEGTTTANPFVTVDEAANAVAAADTVYVGAGVYREQVTIDTNGTSGSPITWNADVTGAYTGDAGLVIISAYNSEASTATRGSCLADSGADVKYNIFNGFTLVGGIFGVVYFDHTGNNSYEGLEFNDCCFVPGHDDANQAMFFEYNAVTAPTGNGLRIRRCMFSGAGLEVQYDEDTTEKDWDIAIEDCVFVGGTTNASSIGIVFDRISISTIAPGGAAITNCLFVGVYYPIRSLDAITAAPTSKWVIRNCVFSNCHNGILYTTTDPFDGDYNTFLRGGGYANAGTNSRQEVDDPGLWGGFGDWTLWRYWGWSPYRPWEPITTPDASYVNAVIGTGNAATATATDAYNSPRPMGPGADNADDRGAVEARARLEPETTTVRTGSFAGRFEGAGWHDYHIPVNQASTTVTIYARYDSNYTGSLPKIELMNAPGVTSLPSDTVTGAANQWEQLSINFTPTGKGIARVRISSQDTSTTGLAFFDDLDVSG